MRLFRVSLVVAVALAATGCGAAKKQAASGGASLVPATAPAFVSIDTDLSSDQWKKVDGLLEKFPGRSFLLRGVNDELTKNGADYSNDVKPALGPEVDIVWLDFANGGSNAVVLTQPKDSAKFKVLVDKTNKADPSSAQAVISKIGDWTVVADAMATIDRFRSESTGAKKLTDDGQFKDAMGQLPNKSILSVYARGRALIDAVRQAIPATVPGRTFDFTAGQPEYLAAALSAEGDGLQLVGASRTKAKPKATDYTSKLLAHVPGDALMFVSFRGGDQVDEQLRRLQTNPQYRPALRQFEKSLGIQVAPLLGLLKGELALYVRPQAPIPEVTLVLEAADEQTALTTIDKMVRRLTPKIASAQQDGVTVKTADFGAFAVSYATFDKKLVITNGDQAIQAFRSSSSKLPDAKAFKDARAAAGAPDKAGAFVYVNLKDGIPLLERYAGLAGGSVPLQVRQNLAPLKALVAWSTISGQTSAVKLFLQIQ